MMRTITPLLVFFSLFVTIGARQATAQAGQKYARYEKKLPSDYLHERETEAKKDAAQPALQPQPPAGPTVSAYDLYNYGVDLQNNGRDAEAAEAYSQAIGKLKTLTDAYMNRGIIYSRMGDWDKAITDYNFYIRRKPDTPDGYINRGAAYTGRGDYAQALADYQRALALNPKSDQMKSIFYERARMYYHAGQFRESYADWKQILATDPTASIVPGGANGVRLNRAVCYLKLAEQAASDETRRAQAGIVISDCGQLLKPNIPEDVQNEASLLRAEAYELLGQTPFALEDVNRIITARPMERDAYLLRARLYDTVGRTVEADADRKRAAELKKP